MHSIGITNEVDAVFKQPVGTGKSKAKGQALVKWKVGVYNLQSHLRC